MTVFSWFVRGARMLPVGLTMDGIKTQNTTGAGDGIFAVGEDSGSDNELTLPLSQLTTGKVMKEFPKKTAINTALITKLDIMSGREDGALPKYNIIDSPSFTVTTPLSRALMTDLFCNAPTEYLPLLQNGRGDIPAMIDPNSSKPYVTTLMDVVVDGTDVNDVWLNVYRKRKPIQFEALSLFPRAPVLSYIQWDDPDLQAFRFHAGCLASDWVEASSIGIAYLKGSLLTDGHLSHEELEAAEMADFCLRLLVKPLKNVLDLQVSIAAVPLSLEQLRALPVDFNLLSFPCIQVWKTFGQHSVIFPGQHSVIFPGQPGAVRRLKPGLTRATNGDGMPAYPILTATSPDCPEHLDCDLVRKAMYTQWTGKDTLNIVSRDDWRVNVYPGGDSPPKLTDYSQAFSWPELDVHAEDKEAAQSVVTGHRPWLLSSLVAALVVALVAVCIIGSRSGPPPKRDNASIIAVGNPGVGKSTILNCLAEEVLFKSGVNFGGGLTFQMDAKPDKDGRMYYDTPGMADRKLREAAGKAITKALRKGGEYKILFFLRMEDGRVVGEDVTTLKLVLDSAPEIGDQYGLVINKVSTEMATKLQENPKNVKAFLAQIFANIDKRICKEENIVFLPINSAIAARDDTLIPLKDLKTIDGSPFKDYVTKNLSSIELTEGKANDIDIQDFEKATEEIETLKKEMNEDKKKFDKKLKEMEEEMRSKREEADKKQKETFKKEMRENKKMFEEKLKETEEEMKRKVQQAENASGFLWKTTGGISAAGIGATIGTFILPGPGTAIGATVGAIGGTAIGAIGEAIANN